MCALGHLDWLSVQNVTFTSSHRQLFHSDESVGVITKSRSLRLLSYSDLMLVFSCAVVVAQSQV